MSGRQKFVGHGMHHTDKQYLLPPESDESFSPLARQILSLPAWWFNRRPEDGSTLVPCDAYPRM